ncbi:hypothetical protein BRD00_02065 [Halobacteriales archaeon QS_8_69_26]|nr:MAG: hypothetical protein BRD00_02065 [Halobacteriales archaeon QS_8_69_26]
MPACARPLVPSNRRLLFFTSEHRHMVECDSCGATVDEEATTCPNCGYSPRKTLLLNGAVYAAVMALILFVGAPLVASLGAPILHTGIVAFVLSLLTGYYGLYLILMGGSATVAKPLDGYLGLVID